jgi:hypothetical protein
MKKIIVAVLGIAIMTRHTKRITIWTGQKEEDVVPQNRHR